MATVPHVTSGLGLRKFQADGFLLTQVYNDSVLKENVPTPKSSGQPTSSRFYSTWRQSDEYQMTAAQDLPPCSLVVRTCSTHRQGRRNDYQASRTSWGPARPRWLQPPAVRRLPTLFGHAGPSTNTQHYFTQAMFYTTRTGTFRWLRRNLPEMT